MKVSTEFVNSINVCGIGISRSLSLSHSHQKWSKNRYRYLFCYIPFHHTLRYNTYNIYIHLRLWLHLYSDSLDSVCLLLNPLCFFVSTHSFLPCIICSPSGQHTEFNWSTIIYCQVLCGAFIRRGYFHCWIDVLYMSELRWKRIRNSSNDHTSTEQGTGKPAHTHTHKTSYGITFVIERKKTN